MDSKLRISGLAGRLLRGSSAACALVLISALGFVAPARAGLMHHWKFDETSGAVAHDSAGSLDLTLNNFPGDDSQWLKGTGDAAPIGFGLDQTNGYRHPHPPVVAWPPSRLPIRARRSVPTRR